jgi:hypothetical protein
MGGRTRKSNGFDISPCVGVSGKVSAVPAKQAAGIITPITSQSMGVPGRGWRDPDIDTSR